MRQFTSIDLHRTRSGAKSIRRTSLVTIVFILLAKRSGSLGISTCRLEITDLTLYSDTHSGGQRQSTRHTVDLTEAAFNTLVGSLHLFDGLLGRRELRIHQITTAIRYALEIIVEHGQWFQALDETLGIVVEDNALVQQTVGVEDGLQLLHHLISLVTPFVFHKRRHVATCTMLSLERAVITLNHKFGYIAHHLGIAINLIFALETLIQDEVVVTLEGMTVDTGIVVAVIGYQLLQLHRSLGQRLDGEGHIFNQARGAYGTCATHTWEDA